MKLKYMLVTILMYILLIPNVYATTCDKEDRLNKKEIANSVEITATLAKDENGKDTGNYNLTIKGLDNEFYIEETVTDQLYSSNTFTNGTLTINNLESGNYRFKIYYDVCADELLKTIKYRLPKYNHYANNSLCKGITKDDLDVCDKFYQGELTDEIFEQRIYDYLQKKENIAQQEKKENSIPNKIIKFVKEYYIYVIAALIFLVIIISRIVINKKRGVLE